MPTSLEGQLRRSSTRFVPARMSSAYFGLMDSRTALPLGCSQDSGKRLICNTDNGLDRAADDAELAQMLETNHVFEMTDQAEQHDRGLGARHFLNLLLSVHRPPAHDPGDFVGGMRPLIALDDAQCGYSPRIKAAVEQDNVTALGPPVRRVA